MPPFARICKIAKNYEMYAVQKMKSDFLQFFACQTNKILLLKWCSRPCLGRQGRGLCSAHGPARLVLLDEFLREVCSCSVLLRARAGAWRAGSPKLLLQTLAQPAELGPLQTTWPASVSTPVPWQLGACKLARLASLHGLPAYSTARGLFAKCRERTSD